MKRAFFSPSNHRRDRERHSRKWPPRIFEEWRDRSKVSVKNWTMGNEISQCVEDMTGGLGEVDICDQANREDGEVAAGPLWQRPSRSKLAGVTKSSRGGGARLKVRKALHPSFVYVCNRNVRDSSTIVIIYTKTSLPFPTSSLPYPPLSSAPGTF